MHTKHQKDLLNHMLNKKNQLKCHKIKSYSSYI